tara:strand:+ start:354 stop:578 length:225 start_codon:yes stop_codon:yes gene_type:complete
MNHIVSFTPSRLGPLKQAYEEAQRLHCKAENFVQCCRYEMDNSLQQMADKDERIAFNELHFARRAYRDELDKQL